MGRSLMKPASWWGEHTSLSMRWSLLSYLFDKGAQLKRLSWEAMVSSGQAQLSMGHVGCRAIV